MIENIINQEKAVMGIFTFYNINFQPIRVFVLLFLLIGVSYLELEGISVIRAGDEVCVDTSSATELSLVGAVLLQPHTVPLARTIRLTCYTT